MITIAENLQILVDSKAAIKESLENQGKEPTDKLGTYAGLIDTLENPDEVSYCVTLDGEEKAFAQLYGQEKVTLTATENDLRIGTSAISDHGYMEGSKEIPSYYSRYGSKVIQKGKEAILSNPENDYKSLMVTIAAYDTSSGGTAVNYVSVSNSMYEAKSTTKLSDISIDTTKGEIDLGITVNVLSILRYFVVREEG